MIFKAERVIAGCALGEAEGHAGEGVGQVALGVNGIILLDNRNLTGRQVIAQQDVGEVKVQLAAGEGGGDRNGGINLGLLFMLGKQLGQQFVLNHLLGFRVVDSGDGGVVIVILVLVIVEFD